MSARIVLSIVPASEVGDRPRIWLTADSRPFLIMKSGAPLTLDGKPDDGDDYTHAIVATTDEAPDPAERAFWEASYCAALAALVPGQRQALTAVACLASEHATAALHSWRARWAK